MLRIQQLALILVLLGTLAACGNTVPAAQNPTPGAAAGGRATAAPSASRVPPTARLAATAGLVATAAAPAEATSAPQPTAPGAPGAALAEGLTPEGYHYLGQADAPATLVMYSDFL